MVRDRTRGYRFQIMSESFTSASPITSVITCAYSMERWDDLADAVNSLRGLEQRPDEIIIVIDHNPELKARAQAAFPDVLVIENQHARGASGARNAGIAVARGEVIAFLDDDAVADPHWLAALLAVCQRPGVLGVMGRIEPLWRHTRPTWFPEEFMWVIGCTYTGLPEKVGVVRNLFGSMCFRRDLFAKVGVFNAGVGRTEQSFPWSGEETELCMRAQRLKVPGQFMFEPRAVVGHKIPAKRLTYRYFLLRCYAEGVSKAHVAALQPSSKALWVERDYVLYVLTRGVLRGLADAVFRFDLNGLRRAVAITAGLSVTVAGFFVGKTRASRTNGRFAETPAAANPVV
jgi:glucosyl-dolichyl phosphate glucuronosyltransferase